MLADISLQSLLDIFERINKSVISAINYYHDIEIVNTRYEYLKELWISILLRYEKGRRYCWESKSNLQRPFDVRRNPSTFPEENRL